MKQFQQYKYFCVKLLILGNRSSRIQSPTIQNLILTILNNEIRLIQNLTSESDFGVTLISIFLRFQPIFD